MISLAAETVKQAFGSDSSFDSAPCGRFAQDDKIARAASQDAVAPVTLET